MRITEILEQTAARFPDKAAFIDEKRSMSFSELVKEAKDYASALTCRNMPVYIETDRTVASVVRMMGVLFSGNYYVPVESKAPQARKDSIKEQLLRAKPSEGLAYILFTSGSTGTPKGVEIEEKSVINFARVFTETMGIDETVIFGNQSPLCFDASMEELYATIMCGCTTHLMPKKFFSFPKLFAEYINEHKINALNLSATAFAIMAESGVLRAYPPKYLRLVLAGNETVYAKHLNEWLAACPGVRFVNAYGPTEATVDSSYYFADKALPDGESVPIGKPCKGTEILLINENGNEAAEGEMFISGPGLARGYYMDSEKTAATFIMRGGKRWYKSGDLARLNADGDLVFVGRLDNQIKRAGYRIELGEIEAAVLNQDGVSEAACIYMEEEDRIVCFYSGRAEEFALAAAMRKELPPYMLPGEYHRLGSLPKTINDKIDRKALINER
jgi:D-alanine--poly(phosphoribitol) ligase subunit 1